MNGRIRFTQAKFSLRTVRRSNDPAEIYSQNAFRNFILELVFLKAFCSLRTVRRSNDPAEI